MARRTLNVTLFRVLEFVGYVTEEDTSALELPSSHADIEEYLAVSRHLATLRGDRSRYQGCEKTLQQSLTAASSDTVLAVKVNLNGVEKARSNVQKVVRGIVKMVRA